MDLAKLEYLTQMQEGPAFVMDGGQLLCCNREALLLGLAPGCAPESVLQGLRPGWTASSSLSLPVRYEKRTLELRTLELEGALFCVLREPSELPAPNVQTVTRAVSIMQSAMQDLIDGIERMSELPALQDPESAKIVAMSVRSIHRLTRTASNLELYNSLRQRSYPLNRQMHWLVSELLSFCMEAEELLQDANVCLRYQLDLADFRCTMDMPLIQHLLWELLANAAAHCRDGIVGFRLQRVERRLIFRVTNRSDKPLPPSALTLHAAQINRFSDGMGMGLALVCAGAQLYGGSLLLSQDKDGLVEAVLNIQLGEDPDPVIHSFSFFPLSRFHPGLLALSGVLPVESYRPEDVL